MLLTINDCSFDLRNIFMVDKVEGTTSFSSYTVYFDSGKTLEIYENRSSGGLQMKRDDFIKLWKKARFKEE